MKVTLRRGELWGEAVITVGTIRRGIHGEPRLKYIYVDSKATAVHGQTRLVEKLSDLPRVLTEFEKADKKARN